MPTTTITYSAVQSRSLNGHHHEPIDIKVSIANANEILHKAGFVNLNLSSELYYVGSRDIIPCLIGTFPSDCQEKLNNILASHDFKKLFPEGISATSSCLNNATGQITILQDLK